MSLLFLSLLSVLLATCVSGSADVCQNSEAVDHVLEKCKMELDLTVTDNYTADCTSGVVQQYVDCLHEVGGCIELMSTAQGTLAEAYGLDTNIEVLTEGGRNARGCQWYCNSRCSCCPFRCSEFGCGVSCSFGKRDVSEPPAECKVTIKPSVSDKDVTPQTEHVTPQTEMITGAAFAVKPAIVVGLFLIAAVALLV